MVKISPKHHAVVYLSTKNIVTSFFASVAPVIGGWHADYFIQSFLANHVTWARPRIEKVFHLFSLHGFNFLFHIRAFLALMALELWVHVNAVGEVRKSLARRIIRKTFRSNVKDFFCYRNIDLVAQSYMANGAQAINVVVSARGYRPHHTL